MPVDIQSKCCSGMAQIPLDCFDVISGTDCGHRVAGAEVVEAAKGTVLDTVYLLTGEEETK